MNEQEQQIRIAIVDDHEMFRAGVIATLQPHFDIVMLLAILLVLFVGFVTRLASRLLFAR